MMANQSRFYGARRAHGVRTDAAWANKQEANIHGLRTIYGHDVQVHAVPRRTKAVVYANDGRWVLDCACQAGVIVDLNLGRARCHECGAVYDSAQLRVPKNWRAIEDALLMRPHAHNRNWQPGETVDDLQRENRSHGLPDGR